MQQPKTHYTVDDIQIIEAKGPWASKSGGELHVLFGLTREQVAAFLDYDSEEFARVEAESGVNIRGLRSYAVSGIAKGSVGAKECHLARMEYVRAAKGSARWTCVDTNGKTREFTLDGKTSVITPPGILHTYTALEDNTELQVICNTLFIPEDPRTHDSYLEEDFHQMRAKLATNIATDKNE